MNDDVPLTLREVLDALEGLYPPSTAQSWDRVGLVTGDPEQPVRRIHLAVDPTLAVVEEARDLGADLLLTHHPLLLRGVHSVATTSAKGATVTALVVGDVALYVAHTNADVAGEGVCEALAEACGLGHTDPLALVEDQPLGRVGDLAEPLTLRRFVDDLAVHLPATAGGVRVAGPPEALVTRVAVLGGSGDDQLDAVRASGADVYVTADLRHHPALEAREEARGGTPYLVDAGHWASEWLWLSRADRALRTALGDDVTRVETHISTVRTDPWTFVVGADQGGYPVRAEPARQLRLLDLQAIDTRLDQIEHARRTLPQLAELADLEGKARLLDDQLVRSRTELGDVQREVAKAEADVQLVRDRAARDRSRLDAGTGTAKDLQALQHELESLARRQAELEDVELEVMERAEAVEHDVSELERGRAELGERIARVEADRDDALGRLAAEEGTVGAPRGDVVAEVGDDLVALYEKIRGGSGGTGAAALRQRRCGGCQLELNPVDLQRIGSADDDEVLRCEECRRILVRTPESGL